MKVLVVLVVLILLLPAGCTYSDTSPSRASLTVEGGTMEIEGNVHLILDGTQKRMLEVE